LPKIFSVLADLIHHASPLVLTSLVYVSCPLK
jgi:hypothetical protein